MEIVASAARAVGATSPSESPPPLPRPESVDGAEDWRIEMRRAIRDGRELLRHLRLDSLPLATGGVERFPVFVPRPFLARIRPGDPLDPLLLQVLPGPAEDLSADGFSSDPVGDLAARQRSGLLQKYAGRALLIVTGNCAVHCRYCFRREFPYASDRAWPSDWPATLDHLAADRSIDEVLLSGGDPLTLADDRLLPLLDDLETIGHLRRIRIHTRLPIMIPSRVTDALVERLDRGPTAKTIVIHANHARELDAEVRDALLRLARVATLLNQSVLLRGINDSVQALAELSERLLDCRTLPYYLHRLDRVVGASAFEVTEAEGIALVAELRRRLPGYAVPRFVREEAGEPHKTPIA